MEKQKERLMYMEIQLDIETRGEKRKKEGKEKKKVFGGGGREEIVLHCEYR